MTGRRVLGALVALGLVLALVGVGTGWWLSRGEDVPVPADDASAEEVVTAYVAALDQRDADTLAALRVDGVAPGWALGPVLLEGRTTHRDLRVDTAREDPGGRSAYVGVGFVLERTPAPFPDVSVPEGPSGWGYVLERRTSSDPWRVADEGVG